MTVKEFYDSIGGSYQEVLSRLPNDDLIKKFITFFKNDQSYQSLVKAIEKRDVKESFEFCHKLKGVVGNMSFKELYEATSELCEQLRPLDSVADEQLFLNLKKEYERVLSQIILLEAN